MWKNKNVLREQMKLKNGLITLPRIFVSVFLIIIFANVSSAILDCSMCHKTAPGSAAVRAADTIEISNKTCLKCHNPDYPPKPIGYNTHLAHVGKYSANVDFFSRHPKVADSISCNSCHVNIGENCRNCHVKGIPHIEPPLGYNCKGCHGVLDKLFQHPTIDLKIHNIFSTNGVNGTRACAMCHNPDNMASLKLASGELVPIQDAYRLCFQCHSGYYNLWISGQHYSNYTVPSDEAISSSNGMGADIGEIKTGLEDKWKRENTCQSCHNPHNPKELYKLPVSGHEKTVDTGMATVILYALIALMIIIAIIIGLVIKKKRLTLSDVKKMKLSEIKNVKLPKVTLSSIKNIKLPKLKLPKFDLSKISIPISLSVEKLDSNGNVISTPSKDDTVVTYDNTKDVEQKQTGEHKQAETLTGGTLPISEKETVSKPEKKTFVQRYKKDIAFILILCLMSGMFYVIFGSFAPFAIVASESMSPNINKGDVVFYTDISRIDKISTNDKKNVVSFGDYGDVVLYKPYGQEGVSPYVHRAMYYVSQGSEMWPGGTIAPYSGYVTKGDNTETNKLYDQQLSTSRDTPVKREWIVGIARFRIPYIGYIRLMLP